MSEPLQIVNPGNCTCCWVPGRSQPSEWNILKLDFASGREVSCAGGLGGLYRPASPRAGAWVLELGEDKEKAISHGFSHPGR